MTAQPEALRLATVFEDPGEPKLHLITYAAAELRRQHSRIAELEAALDLALEALKSVTKHFTKVPSSLKDSEARGVAHAAIAKLKGLKK